MANMLESVKDKSTEKKDEFSVCGVDINNVIEKDKFVMKAAQKGVKIETLRTDLVETMSIKVENNTEIDRQKRIKQAKFNHNLINFDEEKQKRISKKNTDSDREEIG